MRVRSRSLFPVVILATLALACVALGGADPACRQGKGDVLFLDDHIVDTTSSLCRTMHRPQKRGAVLKPDVPSDGYMVQIRSAPVWVEKERLFKLVYLAYHDPYLPVNVGNQPGPAYAVSKDGLHWEKPSLGQVEVRGSTDNNRIATVSTTATWPTNSLTDFVYDSTDSGSEPAIQRTARRDESATCD